MCSLSPEQRLAQTVEPLLLWYSQNRRTLPWRESPTPYHVWISEIMLQQTRVEAVKGYYARFLQALPTIEALASCPEEQLLKLWEGLGYYSRARNLQKAAQLLVTQYGGQLPSRYDELRKLPGIGDYTAGAIASIAFDQPVPAVDGNLLRVIARLLCSDQDISLPATKIALQKLLAPIMPAHGSGNYNQAFMDLGSMVCLPNAAPQCLVCPLQTLCLAHQQGQEESFPVKSKRKPRRIEQRTLLLFDCSFPEGNATLLHRRPNKGVLSGMWEFPAVPGTLSQEEALREALQLAQPLGLFIRRIAPQCSSKHLFTHIEWQLSAWMLYAGADSLQAAQALLPPEYALVQNIDQITLPSAFGAYRKLFHR